MSRVLRYIAVAAILFVFLNWAAPGFSKLAAVVLMRPLLSALLQATFVHAGKRAVWRLLPAGRLRYELFKERDGVLPWAICTTGAVLFLALLFWAVQIQ